MTNMIYCVHFHTKSPKKPHSFWFTDKEKAVGFYNSVKEHQKVTDYAFYEIDADLADVYDRSVKDAEVRPINP